MKGLLIGVVLVAFLALGSATLLPDTNKTPGEIKTNVLNNENVDMNSYFEKAINRANELSQQAENRQRAIERELECVEFGVGCEELESYDRAQRDDEYFESNTNLEEWGWDDGSGVYPPAVEVPDILNLQ